ncbi:MAG: hypothetical protein BWY64_02377 [bacterium ADurb.Bin363]|nr:MAG: hypothetical protein BWY64_02377 [bacterium ADurb.Bin363]
MNYNNNVRISSNFTFVRIAERNTPITSNFTSVRIVEENTPITSRYGYPLYFFCPNTKIKSKYIKADYFNSFDPNYALDPSLVERDSKFTARIYLQAPELGVEYLLDEIECDDLEVLWGLNQPIIAGFTLQNYNRRYTTNDKTNDYYGLFEEGPYCYARSTRKFIKIELCSFCGNQFLFLRFPRLVIKEVSGVYTLHISCVDEISELLFRQMDLDTYTPEETLIPIEGSSGRFQSLSLTRNEYNFNTEFLVNYQRATPFAHDPSTRIWTTRADIEDGIPVVVCNPLSAKWIIKDLCQNVVNAQPSIITKEHFPLEINFLDFNIYNNIPIQNIEPIRVIEDILRARPGEWLIKPVGDRLSLVLREVVLDSEYPSAPEFSIPPTLMRGDASLSRTNIKRVNTINVIRPSVLQTAKKRITVEV